jgi:hypothetical protein
MFSSGKHSQTCPAHRLALPSSPFWQNQAKAVFSCAVSFSDYAYMDIFMQVLQRFGRDLEGVQFET